MNNALKTIISYGLWPALLAGCLAVTVFGMHIGHGILVFNIAYLSLAVTLFFTERLMPFEKSWLGNDGQLMADLCHTAFNKGAVQVLIAVGAAFGIAEAFASDVGGHLWPTHWPLAFQVVLGLVMIEIGLYAAHRLAHEWPLLWRFHAVHHSSKRLSFINTGRFHVVDTVASIALSQPILFLFGAPIEVFQLVSATTAFIGMLTHCNVDMKFGWIAYIVNTPTLHRFHHSKKLVEGNTNYGENLMFMDLLLGTYYNKPNRPSANIGINEPMPDNFLGQIAQPFRRRPVQNQNLSEGSV